MILQQFAVLIHQIQGPESYTVPPAPPTQPTVTTVSDTQPPLLPISYPPAPPVTNPAPAQAPPQPVATNNFTPTFFAFVIHHIRTDPQARLCASGIASI